MPLSYRVTGDRCPYDIVSRNMVACPRFTPLVAADRFACTISSCAHARGSIARPAPGDAGLGSFYLRCLLRTGDVEAERDLVVPLD